MMKRNLALGAAVLVLCGCTPKEPEKPVLMNPAQAGEFCGGIAGIACAEGLTCKLEGRYPDAGGTCVASRTK